MDEQRSQVEPVARWAREKAGGWVEHHRWIHSSSGQAAHGAGLNAAVCSAARVSATAAATSLRPRSSGSCSHSRSRLARTRLPLGVGHHRQAAARAREVAQARAVDALLVGELAVLDLCEVLAQIHHRRPMAGPFDRGRPQDLAYASHPRRRTCRRRCRAARAHPVGAAPARSPPARRSGRTSGTRRRP